MNAPKVVSVIVLGLSFNNVGCAIFGPIENTYQVSTQSIMRTIAEDIRTLEAACGLTISPPLLASLADSECAKKTLAASHYSIADRYKDRRSFIDSWERPLIFSKNEKGRFLLSLGEDGRPGGRGQAEDIFVEVNAR